jgi:hypothetical protein
MLESTARRKLVPLCVSPGKDRRCHLRTREYLTWRGPNLALPVALSVSINHRRCTCVLALNCGHCASWSLRELATVVATCLSQQNLATRGGILRVVLRRQVAETALGSLITLKRARSEHGPVRPCLWHVGQDCRCGRPRTSQQVRSGQDLVEIRTLRTCITRCCTHVPHSCQRRCSSRLQVAVYMLVQGSNACAAPALSSWPAGKHRRAFQGHKSHPCARPPRYTPSDELAATRTWHARRCWQLCKGCSAKGRHPAQGIILRRV